LVPFRVSSVEIIRRNGRLVVADCTLRDTCDKIAGAIET
jgi:hypothetical protein